MSINVDGAHFKVWQSIHDESARRNPDTHRKLRIVISTMFNLLVAIAAAHLLYPTAVKYHNEAIECEASGSQNCAFGLPVTLFWDACFLGIWAYICFVSFLVTTAVVNRVLGHSHDAIYGRLVQYDTVQGVALAKKMLGKFGDKVDVGAEFDTTKFQDALAAYLFHH